MSSTSITGKLKSGWACLQQAFRNEPSPSLSERLGWLTALESMLLIQKEPLIEAIDADFGHRSAHETQLLEIFPLVDMLRHTRANLKNWMRPQRRGVGIWFLGAHNRVLPQPKGVVGVMVPWNYPLMLSLGPMISALCAGNRVMIKMSEHSPALTALLQKLLQEALGDELVQVYADELGLGPEFAKLNFDHLMFTGSSATGRKVMASAAQTLTPVTLELGGKSPVIVADDYSLDKAVARILHGKLLNAGQTCVAPDYVLLPKGQTNAFVEAAQRFVTKHYGDTRSDDYTSIINDDSYARLQRLVTDAQLKGADVVTLGSDDRGGRKMAPRLVARVTDDMPLMVEEIFGPILPLVEYQSVEEAVASINQRPRPLALYLFTDDPELQLFVLEETRSGGVCLNDVVMHVGQHELPFGGSGDSGMGQYHGYAGFLEFSKMRPIFHQAKRSSISLLRPPYKTRMNFLLKLMLRG
jgi:acyl-CoA reductase-like NAD-dependent aldehyde dehydrogenase